MAAGDFWNNQEKAQATVAELKGLRTVVTPLKDALSAAEGAAPEPGLAAFGRRAADAGDRTRADDQSSIAGA